MLTNFQFDIGDEVFVIKQNKNTYEYQVDENFRYMIEEVLIGRDRTKITARFILSTEEFKLVSHKDHLTELRYSECFHDKKSAEDACKDLNLEVLRKKRKELEDTIDDMAKRLAFHAGTVATLREKLEKVKLDNDLLRQNAGEKNIV